jgi:hypothetical protein
MTIVGWIWATDSGGAGGAGGAGASGGAAEAMAASISDRSMWSVGGWTGGW